MTQRLTVGKIVNTHGLRGEVRVIAETDFPEQRFAPGSKLFVETSPATPVTVASTRQHKQFTLVTFTGLTDINQVEAFKGHALTVDAAVLAHDLAPDTYYYADIVGLTIITDAGETLGTVSEILPLGPNDVWVVQRPGKADVLLPFLKSVVTKVDLATKTAYVTVPEGLIDDAD